MIPEILIKEAPQGLMELCGSIEILSGEDLLPCVFPQPLNDVEVRGIRRQEDKLDAELRGLLHHGAAVLVPGVVDHDGHGKVSGCLPYLFKEGLRLFGVDVHHGMYGYEVKGEGVDASEQVEAVASGPCLKEERIPAPYIAGEGLKREVDGIHEGEPAPSLRRFLHNPLEISHPFLLFSGIGLAGYRLELPETEAAAPQDDPCPRQSDGDSRDVTYGVRRLSPAACRLLIEFTRHLLQMSVQTSGTSRFRKRAQNRTDAFLVICIDEGGYEITAASRGFGDTAASKPRLAHLGHEGSATFTDNGGAVGLGFFLEEGIRLLAILDGEQCVMDYVRKKCIIHKRRLPSFIGLDGHNHFAQILYALPITSFKLRKSVD